MMRLDKGLMEGDKQVVIVGAGPAGLTAAYELCKVSVPVTVFEADEVVGGLSRTVERNGFRFDIGGHRFFTKVERVQSIWREWLSEDEFPIRKRLSRIYYNGHFFDYPLRWSNALSGLGFIEALRCLGSYLWVKLRPPIDRDSYESWVASRFGWRLYNIFFAQYTEKVWGVPGSAITADWAVQRIRGLSLGKAVLSSIVSKLPGVDLMTEPSLIHQFRYPLYGPGMMWERASQRVMQMGGNLVCGARVVRIDHEDGLANHVVAIYNGEVLSCPARAVISSMPIAELLHVMQPPPPPEVLEAADGLHHRDFLTVALVVPESVGFPDNWIYVHDPTVLVGRIQNYRSWSEHMAPAGKTCLGLEYFVNAGEGIWNMSDEELVELGKLELAALGIVKGHEVEGGYVVRVPKAYPLYDSKYHYNLEICKQWIAHHASNVFPVGRNGMHRYNNQDHSMLTGVLAAECVMGARHDLWSVNVERSYHEDGSEPLLVREPVKEDSWMTSHI